nr:methyl-accepting chemotaxis protein [uncultured Roseateles sp.]
MSNWRLDELSLKALLSAGFGSVALLIAALGAAGWLGIGALNARVDELVRGQYPRMALVGEVERDVREMGRSLRNLLLWNDIREIKQETARVQAARKQLGQDLEAVAARITTTEGLAILARMQQAGKTYLLLQRRFEDLVNAGSSDDGRDLLKAEVIPAEAVFQAGVQELLRHETEAMAAAAEQATASATRLQRGIAAGALFALLLALLLAWWIVRTTTRPLQRAVRLARGVAAGDLSLAIEAPGRSETAQLLQALAEMQVGLSGVVGQVRSNAEHLAAASQEIAQGNQDLSGRTEQQAGALEQTAAAMEQLGSTVRNNAEQAGQASRLAQDASAVALRGGAVVGEVVATMKDIIDSSRRIAEITGVIDGIAFQTNILALNAAVEAARAGDQGRGFAVVAGEVRSLAQRSAEAAKTISGLINVSVGRVEQGSLLVDRAGATMQEVVAAIGRVSGLVADISRASAEQSSGVAQVGEAITHMDHATQQNAALVEQSAAAALSLQQQAAHLLQSVAVFKLAPTSPSFPSTSKESL